MRKLLIYLLTLLCVSCTDMHDPILHGGGYVKFIPECAHELDSVVVDRMNRYYAYSWKEEWFSQDLNDFNIILNNERSFDFIDESEPMHVPYGSYNVLWSTNPYQNNIYEQSSIYTESLADSISVQPDFLYAQTSRINVSEKLHDYTYNENMYVQIFREQLPQRSFRYMVQVTLHNNEGRVLKAGSFLAGGIARSYNVSAGQNAGVTSHVFKPRLENDVIIGSFTSFGLPDCDSYEFRYNYRKNPQHYFKSGIYLIVQLIYNNGSRILKYDISDQACLQPTGGLILLNIDIDDYPEPSTPEATDPFNVLVSDYENTDQYFNQL